MAPEESARLMIYAARQGRAIAQHCLPRRGRRAKGKRAVQSKILQGLPQVGPERAKHLLDHFGSVESALTAKIEELREVEGIGEYVAETLRWAVREEDQQIDPSSIGAKIDTRRLSVRRCGRMAGCFGEC